jgi:nicotinamide-nucleotide amidase
MSTSAVAELICVGTELLLGEILNSNAQFLAQELAALGIDHHYQTVVGDNPQRIQRIIAHACDANTPGRSKILIFTGGLGPTPDDLTTETIADFFDTPLIERSEIVTLLRERYAQRGRPLTPSNLKQALVPQGAEILPNPTGTAPGMIWQPRPGLHILTFPGVPSEMKRMWRDTAVPYLRQQGFGQGVLVSRNLRFWGISEAALAEQVSTFFDQTNPTVAPYASQGEVRLRVTARATTPEEAIVLLEPTAEQLKTIAGRFYFGSDDESLASVVGNLLQSRQETLGVAESCTGGGVGEALTAIPGSSAYFWGGVIAYDNQIKERVLQVDPQVLAAEGAVSGLVAEQMARGVRSLLQTDWGLSITGIAGPGGGTETKPVGLVYIGITDPQGQMYHYPCRWGTQQPRALIRRLSVCEAIDRLRHHLLKRDDLS